VTAARGRPRRPQQNAPAARTVENRRAAGAPCPRAGCTNRPEAQALAGACRLRATPVSSAAWATAVATAGATPRLNTLGTM
jgi:hypothetical protein